MTSVKEAVNLRWLSEGALALLVRGVKVNGSDYDWVKQAWRPKVEPLPPADLATDTLICSKCKEWKGREKFHKRPDKYSGGRGCSYYCKDCTRASS